MVIANLLSSYRVARVRRDFARLASLVLLGRRAGLMPKSVVESLEKSAWDAAIESHMVASHAVRESLLMRYALLDGLPIYFRREHAFPTRRLFELRDAVVSPFSGLVWFDDFIIVQSVGSIWRLMDWGQMQHEPLVTPLSMSRSDLILACPPTGYYHWLLETWPAVLSALRRYPHATLVVPNEIPVYLRDALALTLPQYGLNHRVIRANTPVRSISVLMPELYATGGFTHPEDIDLLREAILPVVDAQQSDTRAPVRRPRRLYISRRRAAIRRMTGEETLEDALRMRAFECVILEEHSLAEQIQLLRNAEVVVAPHGAGLANIVWADQLRLLVELFLPSYVSDCFAVLAAQLGVEYRYVFTERSEPHIGAGTVMRVLDALDAHAPPANSPICRSTDHVRQDVGNSGVV